MTQKSRLLIVEDDHDLAEMLNAYFRVQGYEVTIAGWGEEAVRVSSEIVPHLIVLDIRLPDIDGYQVCQRIRANRRTQSIPIIFLTEKSDRVDKLAGLELGVVDYITKPFDIQELRLRVRNALQTSTQHPLVNTVTGLAEGDLVTERLEQLVFSDDKWAILLITVLGLDDFRERYGFVATDDVLRAVSLMLNNAVREGGKDDDFIGHQSPTDFLVLTQHDRLQSLKERIQNRLQQSMEYFYPLQDRMKIRETKDEGQLQLIVGQLTVEQGPFKSVDALAEALSVARKKGSVHR